MPDRPIPLPPRTPSALKLLVLAAFVAFALVAAAWWWNRNPAAGGQPVPDTTANMTQPQVWNNVIAMHLKTGRDIDAGTLNYFDSRRRAMAGRQLYEITETFVNEPAYAGQLRAACAALAECWPDLYGACPWCDGQ